VDVRVVVATHRDLRELTRQGQFREDLYYRLCGVPLNLPPLRQRGTDIRLLTEHFVRLFTPREQRVTLTPAALDKLSRHSWPGNIRELRSVVSKAMLFRKSALLDASDMVFEPPLYLEPAASESALHELPAGMTLEQRVEQLERAIVVHTLRRHRFDKERAAQQLGMGRSTLYKRLKAWGLERGEEEPSA
jgi:two-component system, NtrC family, response regulator HydG